MRVRNMRENDHERKWGMDVRSEEREEGKGKGGLTRPQRKEG